MTLLILGLGVWLGGLTLLGVIVPVRWLDRIAERLSQ
jgi:hypothetical protein